MNKAILIGRLTKDPEIRYTQSGKAVGSFTLAVDRHWIKEDSQQPTADFIPVIAWGKLAEVVGNNITKGRRISVDGRIQVRNYTATDGSKRWVTEIVANEIEFLDSKKAGNDQQGEFGQTTGTASGGMGAPVPDEEIPF